MAIPPEDRGYAILGTPRSGSSHLCRLLSSTNVLGKPMEYLNPGHVFKDYPNPDHTIWQKIEAVSRTANGVRGIKAFYGQFDKFTPQEIHHNILRLPIVFITRNDKLRQALSFSRAVQTLQWTSHKVESRKQPEYDIRSIDYYLNQLLHYESTLLHIFAINGIDPFHISYENLMRDPEGTVRDIGRFVGVDDIPVTPTSPLAIQRDAMTEAWRERYLHDRGDSDHLRLFQPETALVRVGRKKLKPLINRIPYVRRWMAAID